VIAKDYGISPNTVGDIAHGRIWKGATINAAFQLVLEQDPL
jgi:hypothetical protein